MGWLFQGSLCFYPVEPRSLLWLLTWACENIKYQSLNVPAVLRPSARKSAFCHPSLSLVEPKILGPSPFLNPGHNLTPACWWIWPETQPAPWFTASSVGSSPIGIWLVRHFGRQDSFETALTIFRLQHQLPTGILWDFLQSSEEQILL